MDVTRLNALTDQLNADLRKSEQYGDELRDTLNKHNLTHLQIRSPGLIEKRGCRMRQINFGMTLSLLLVTTLLISGCVGFKPEKE